MTQATSRRVPLCMTEIAEKVDRTKAIPVTAKNEERSAVEKVGFSNTEEGHCPVCLHQSKTQSEIERLTADPIHPLVLAKANGILVKVCLAHNSVSPIPNEERV